MTSDSESTAIDHHSDDELECIAVGPVADSESPGRKKITCSAPNREDLLPSSDSISTEIPIRVLVHKEYPRFRFVKIILADDGCSTFFKSCRIELWTK